jgi:hypothetical protein
MSAPVAVDSPDLPQQNKLQSLSRRRDILPISIIGFALGLTTAWTVLLAYSFVRLLQFAI